MKLKIIYTIICVALLFSCKSPEARQPVSQNSGSYIDKSIERNKALVSKEEALIGNLIEKDSTNKYLASTNGFWYYYNQKSTDSLNTYQPQFGDELTFDYSISTLKDNPIYVEGEIPTQTYIMDKEELFQGLREGLKLMKEGETVTFLFPSHKAFGYYGDKDKIGTNIPIKTKVTLHSITEKTTN